MKITTEPKALIIHWMSQNPQFVSAPEIRDGIYSEYGREVTDLHCIAVEQIRGYLDASLTPILKRKKSKE